MKVILAPYITYSGDPFHKNPQDVFTYESEGAIFIEDGHIVKVGSYGALKSDIKGDCEIIKYDDHHLVVPGFIDAHVHYPQTQIIGAYGKQLIDWLNNYTFIAEQQFSKKEHATEVSKVFLDECVRAGTTTSAVFCTVHPQSVDAFFEVAQARNMRMIAGKVMMDRNAPEALLDTPQQGYDDTKKLIEKWHGKGRLSYCVTPRFAPTSTPEQLEAVRDVWHEHPGTYLQSHLSENKGEIAWVKELFPDSANYTDVYDSFGLLGERAIYGHGVHLAESELRRLHETGTSIAHCPTSNCFLGSGLFKVDDTKDIKRPVRVGLATDLGAGTSFSQLMTMNEAYKVAQLNGYPLSSIHAFYLATRGAAHSLYLDDKIGSIAPGYEADLVVLNLHSTPAIDYRMKYCKNIEEALFIQMTMADDRATRATYVAGHCVYQDKKL